MRMRQLAYFVVVRKMTKAARAASASLQMSLSMVGKRKDLSGWCFLSFASDETGDFLGAVIVEAPTLADAVQKAWALEINPDGLCAGMELFPAYLPKPIFQNRLLTRDEVKLAFPSGVYNTREGRAIYAVN